MESENLRGKHPEAPEPLYRVQGFPLPRSVVMETADLKVGQQLTTLIPTKSAPGLIEKIIEFTEDRSVAILSAVPYSAVHTQQELMMLIGPVSVSYDMQHLLDLIQDQASL